MAEPLWRLSGVRLGRGEHARLRDVSLSIPPGVTAVLGPSGAGKTSLLNLLVAYERPSVGRVAAHLPGKPRLPLYWVPPDEGLWPHLTAAQHLQAVAHEPVDPLLEAFGLAGRRDARPAVMSAGEKARLAVARAVAADPAVLVMDEPMAHVDRLTAQRCWGAVRRWRAQSGGSIVFATHDSETVLREADHAVCLDAGGVLYEGPVHELYAQPPTRQLACFLGEANWLSPATAALLLGEEIAAPRAYRPERIELVAAPDGPLTIEATRDVGPIGQSELRHDGGEAWRLVHRPTGGRLAAGARAALRLVMMVSLALLLAACGRDPAPSLDVQHIRHWPVPPDGGRIPAPRSITIGPDDQVLVLDNGGRVLVFNPDGSLRRQWAMPTNEDGNPEGACWLRDGRIAVADTHYHRVLIFDAAGEVVDQFGTYDGSGRPGTFRYPVDIVQTPSGELLVSEYGGGDRVQRFTVEGEYLGQFGSAGTGPGQFQRAGGMALHDGRLYIADASNGRVQVFREDGTFVTVLGGDEAPLRFDFPYDLAVAPDGTLFVVEWGAGRISRVSLGGRLLGRFGSPGSSTGQFRTPWGIGVDSHMRVRVADTENRRIVDLQF